MSYFPNVDDINYGGPTSTNPYAFKFYNPDEVIGGKKMEDYLRFAVAYWHTCTEDLSDPFGAGTAVRPWDKYTGMDLAKARVEAAFEFFKKLGVPYFCFHDVDIAPEGNSFKEYVYNFSTIVDLLAQKQEETGIKLLWGTANCFTNKRYMAGAASNPNPEVFACAATQVFN